MHDNHNNFSQLSGLLYLIPTTLGETEDLATILPDRNTEIIIRLKYFIVENLRTARRFLKKSQSGNKYR